MILLKYKIKIAKKKKEKPPCPTSHSLRTTFSEEMINDYKSFYSNLGLIEITPLN